MREPDYPRPSPWPLEGVVEQAGAPVHERGPYRLTGARRTVAEETAAAAAPQTLAAVAPAAWRAQ